MAQKTSFKAFLLCAGFGSRFYPYTQCVSKALIPFLNHPLSAYNLLLLKRMGAKNVLANARVQQKDLPFRLRQQALSLGLKSLKISFEKELLGSAGGLWKAKDFFSSEPHFFYLNGDSFIWPKTINCLGDFYDQHIKSGALASFLTTEALTEHSVLWADSENQIESFVKKPLNNSAIKAHQFCGLALFSAKIFKFIKPGSRHIFTDVLEELCGKEHLSVHSVNHLKMLDMNSLSSYLKETHHALNSLFKKEDHSIFLTKTLDVLNSQWNKFQGDNYVSQTAVPKHFKDQDCYFLGGSHIKGLNKVFVKDFCVAGRNSRFLNSLKVCRSVVSEKSLVGKHLSSDLILF